jgi:predicted PurR-regulated permease PerM
MPDSRVSRETVLGYSVEIYIRLALVTAFAFYSLKVLWPFLSILIWAAILAVALHPLFVWVTSKLRVKASWAATLIAVVCLIVLLLPTVLIVDSLLESIGHWSEIIKTGNLPVPLPPETVKEWPLVGNRVYDIWNGIALNIEATARQYQPQIKNAVASLLGTGVGLALGVMQFALSIIFAAVFLGFAKSLVPGIKRIAERVGNDRGRKSIDMAGATINSVSRGVLGVALIQGGLGAIGVFIGGLPFPGLISALIVMLCIVQMPPLAFIPLIIYAWAAESTSFALVFTIYMLACMLLDNFLKPFLLARGLSTPMVVILIGVIGGTLNAGMLGLFIGPVILAVFFEMIQFWLGSLDGDAEEMENIESTSGTSAEGGNGAH